MLIGLFTLALILGVGCKKSTDVSDLKPSIKLNLKATIEKDPINAGADTYPHNTGACYCGKFAVCHPERYTVIKNGQEYTLFSSPNQTTFPAGATFPGNY